MKNLKEAGISGGTRVFVAGDVDVPTLKGKIVETYRLDNILPTLQYIISRGGHPIIGGHMGSPKGTYSQNFSTTQLLPYFEKNLGAETFTLLENLRFEKGEEENSLEFAQRLIAKTNPQIFVNENFATSHRKNASITRLPGLLPAYAGFRLQKEVDTLRKILTNPERPLTIIIGGAKLESKKPVISKFLPLSDFILVGGKLAFQWEEDIPNNLLLPMDYQTDNKDIGPKTIEKFREIILTSKTILWAGPMGLFEDDNFAHGTNEIAKAIYGATQKNGTFSVVGGGDTVTAVNKIGLLDKFSFVSTGGGAMLEFLAENTLPGIEALG